MGAPQLTSKASDTLAGEEYRKWGRTDFRLLNRFDPFSVNLFGSTPFLFWFSARPLLFYPEHYANMFIICTPEFRRVAAQC
jgi:hypothetical protein